MASSHGVVRNARIRSWYVWRGVAALAAVAALAGPTLTIARGPAGADSPTVPSPALLTACSFSALQSLISSSSGPDVSVSFDLGPYAFCELNDTGTIVVPSGETLTITGPVPSSYGTVIFNGGGQWQLFHVDSGATLNLSNVSLTGGMVQGDPGIPASTGTPPPVPTAPAAPAPAANGQSGSDEGANNGGNGTNATLPGVPGGKGGTGDVSGGGAVAIDRERDRVVGQRRHLQQHRHRWRRPARDARRAGPIRRRWWERLLPADGDAGDGGNGGNGAQGGKGGDGSDGGAAQGGAIDNAGTLTLDNDGFEDNKATGGGGGQGSVGGPGGDGGRARVRR